MVRCGQLFWFQLFWFFNFDIASLNHIYHGMEGGCVRELEATVMATAAELGEMQDVHICALEEAVRLIKVTELREKEEELASSRASCTDAVRQSALGLEQTARA